MLRLANPEGDIRMNEISSHHSSSHVESSSNGFQNKTSPDRELQPADEIRILILDDDPSTCALIQAALAKESFHIDTLSDSQRIEPVLAARPEYHLVIMDYVLPGLDPEQVLGWLRDYVPDASVIVVTGYPSIDSALNCLRARAYDYLTKPFQIHQLREVVTRCLESKGLLRMTEDALQQALGQVIRERRKALHLTLQELSQKTKLSLGYLSQIELGKNSASIGTLYKICLALGMRMSDLFASIQKN